MIQFAGIVLVVVVVLFITLVIRSVQQRIAQEKRGGG